MTKSNINYPKPADFGIPKLSAGLSAAQQAIWLNKMLRFFEEFDRFDRRQRTWRPWPSKRWTSKKSTYLILLNNIDEQILEKILNKTGTFDEYYTPRQTTLKLFYKLFFHIKNQFNNK